MLGIKRATQIGIAALAATACGVLVSTAGGPEYAPLVALIVGGGSLYAMIREEG